MTTSRAPQCPVCFSELELRRVQPCFGCGGWPDWPPSRTVHHFHFKDTTSPITLCNICFLEDVLSGQGDLKARLNIKDRDLVEVDGWDRRAAEWDHFCPTCNHRLALLDLMAQRLSDEELDSWRR